MVQSEQDTREPDAPNTNKKIQSEFPEPRLEDNERTELAPFRYQEEQTLNSSGWVDQNAGVAHIPITKAMELIAQQGLPAAPQAGTAPPSTVGMAQAAAAAANDGGYGGTLHADSGYTVRSPTPSDRDEHMRQTPTSSG